MKRLKFTFFCFLTLLACIREHETYVTYHLDNESGVDVALLFMDMRVPNSASTEFRMVLLANNQRWSYRMGPHASTSYAFGPEVDSAYVTFDADTRVVYIRGDDTPRNILGIESYEGEKLHSGSKDIDSYAYTYTITVEDYQNALIDN